MCGTFRISTLLSLVTKTALLTVALMDWCWRPSEPVVFKLRSELLRALAVSPDGQRVYCGFSSGLLSVYSSGGAHQQTLRAHAPALSCLLSSSSSDRLFSGGDDGLVRLWAATASGVSLRATLRGHHARVKALFVDAAAPSRVWSLGEDCTVRAWRSTDGLAQLCVRGAAEGGSLVAASLCCGWLCASAADGTIAVFRASDGLRTATLSCNQGLVWALLQRPVASSAPAAAPASLLWSAGDDGTVCCWKPATGARVWRSIPSDGPVTCLAAGTGFEAGSGGGGAPAERRVFSGGADGCRGWDGRTGVCVFSFLHNRPVSSIACSPCGATIHTGCIDGTVVDRRDSRSLAGGATFTVWPHGVGLVARVSLAAGVVIGADDVIPTPPASPVHLLLSCSAAGHLWSGSYGGGVTRRCVAPPSEWGRLSHGAWPSGFRFAVGTLLLCATCHGGSGSGGGLDAGIASLAGLSPSTRAGILDTIIAALARTIVAAPPPAALEA